MTERCFVTGGDGFIGSHLVERLVRLGRPVRALVLYDARSSLGCLDSLPAEILREVEVVSGDIRDAPALNRSIRGCDVVFHLAALIGIPYSYRAPLSYVETNVTGTLNVLEAVREAGVRRLVHTSTSEVYGTPQTVPIREDHPLQAQSPYAATKIAADQLALSYHRSFELPVTVVRPFNTYGPRQSPRAIIPTVIGQIAASNRRIRLGALHPTRDFNYVTDTVGGLVAATESDAALGEVVQLGTGFEISIRDLVQEIAGLMEAEVVVETDESRVRPAASEVERLLADNSKAKCLLGWSPRRAGLAGLREGLRETIAWFRDPTHLERHRWAEYHV